MYSGVYFSCKKILTVTIFYIIKWHRKEMYTVNFLHVKIHVQARSINSNVSRDGDTIKDEDNDCAAENSFCCLVFPNTNTRRTPCNGTTIWDASPTWFWFYVFYRMRSISPSCRCNGPVCGPGQGSGGGWRSSVPQRSCLRNLQVNNNCLKLSHGYTVSTKLHRITTETEREQAEYMSTIIFWIQFPNRFYDITCNTQEWTNYTQVPTSIPCPP